jgi:hypothetical protein
VRQTIATLVQLAGLTALTVGAAVLHPAAGWLVGGAALVLVGVASERD